MFVSVAVVITTIQAPTVGVRAIAAGCSSRGFPVVVVGDRKSPPSWHCDDVQYLDFNAQASLPFALANVVPANSYARKMLGYLVAGSSGCEWIRETDDDNEPYPSFFDSAPPSVQARTPRPVDGWVNIYAYFTQRPVWPRGFPLNRLRAAWAAGPIVDNVIDVDGPIVFQAIADGDPDVDAVYRLTAPDVTDVTFEAAMPLAIPADAWTPFNSQATTWPRALLPLMYLPSTCSFRMTDIWRSFIAQRLMAGLGATLVITPATVFQARNAHDLLRDFRDEIEGYTGYERFVGVLAATPLIGGFGHLLEDLRHVYVALVEAELLAEAELPLLDAWLHDMTALGFGA